MESNKSTRERLQQYVMRCDDIVKRMPGSRRADLQGFYPNAEADLTRVQEELYLNECVILVAGNGMKQSCDAIMHFKLSHCRYGLQLFRGSSMLRHEIL